MTERWEILTRALIANLLWLLIAVVAIGANIAVIAGNYMGISNALSLSGYDSMPLGEDLFLGPYIAAFFAKAQLAHWYALAMAIVIGLGAFLIVHMGVKIFRLQQDRAGYRAAGDVASDQAAKRIIIQELAFVGLVGAVLITAMWWDLNLFRYRAIAGASGFDDPRVAASTIQAWGSPGQKTELFSVQLASIGSFGYLAVTLLACIVLELAFGKLGESWSRLLSAVAGFSSRDQENDGRTIGTREYLQFHYGYDASGQPVYDAQTPIAYDVDGHPVETQAVSGLTHDSNAGFESHNPNSSSAYRGDTGTATNDYNKNDAPKPGEPSDEEFLNGHESSSTPEGPTQYEDVIGGNGRRVTREEAYQNPAKFYVDPDGQVFDRKLYENVGGDERAA